MDLNVWTGEGFVGNEPKISYVGGKETPKLNFMIANHRDFNGDNKRTYWIPVTVWGAKAENLMKYVKKGTKVSVVGELEIRSWQDDSGEWQKAVTVNAREVNFFNKRDNGEDTEETVEEPKAKEEAKAAADDLDEFEWD